MVFVEVGRVVVGVVGQVVGVIVQGNTISGYLQD